MLKEIAKRGTPLKSSLSLVSTEPALPPKRRSQTGSPFNEGHWVTKPMIFFLGFSGFFRYLYISIRFFLVLGFVRFPRVFRCLFEGFSRVASFFSFLGVFWFSAVSGLVFLVFFWFPGVFLAFFGVCSFCSKRMFFWVFPVILGFSLVFSVFFLVFLGFF